MDSKLIEQLASELRHARFRISAGSGQTAFNVYLPGDRNRLLVGIYNDGRAWTDCVASGAVTSERLATALGRFGIEIDTSKQWCHWRRGTKPFQLTEQDLKKVVEAVVRDVGGIDS